MRSLLLLAVLVGCDSPQPASPVYDPAGPWEAWVDGGALLVPPLGAVLTVSGADPDGLRVYVVTMGEGLDCGRQLEHDLAVGAANQQWIIDGDHDALLAAIDAADQTLFPPGTWMLRLDLGRRASGEDALVVADIRLFAERRTEDGVDIEITAEFPGVESFEGDSERAFGQLGFGAAWIGPGADDAYHEFTIGFDARLCE